MTPNEQRHTRGAESLILGLGYASALLILIGWIATSGS
jgi:hypothetical protein